MWSCWSVEFEKQCYFPLNQMACLFSAADRGRLKQHVASLGCGMVPTKWHSQETPHSSRVLPALFTSFVDNMCPGQRALLVSPQCGDAQEATLGMPEDILVQEINAFWEYCILRNCLLRACCWLFFWTLYPIFVFFTCILYILEQGLGTSSFESGGGVGKG